MDYKKQGKAVVAKCIAEYGNTAWQAFGPKIRDAIVCQEVVAIAQVAASMGGGTCEDVAEIVAVARDIIR